MAQDETATNEELKTPGFILVEDIVREYPALLAAFRELRYPYARTGDKDPTASAALRELPNEAQRRLGAIRQSIRKIHYHKNGLLCLRLINMVYWKRTHALAEAAAELSCTEQQAALYRDEFISAVKECLGGSDCEGCKYYRAIFQQVKGCCYCRDNFLMRVRDENGCYSKNIGSFCVYNKEVG